MRYKVLIIDDEWAVVRALRARLGSEFELETACDGGSGIAAALDYHPDAILLDMRMPDMDGFEVLKDLRAYPTLAETPVIFLTANIQDTVRQQAKSAGAAGFFSKPYDHQQLITRLHQVISERTAASQRAA